MNIFDIFAAASFEYAVYSNLAATDPLADLVRKARGIHGSSDIAIDFAAVDSDDYDDDCQSRRIESPSFREQTRHVEFRRVGVRS